MKVEITIATLLMDCPKGTKLYSPAYGEVTFEELYGEDNLIAVLDAASCRQEFFNDGSICNWGECLLFPSKDNRDWSTFKAPQKEQPKFKVGDVVVTNKTHDYIYGCISGIENCGEKNMCYRVFVVDGGRAGSLFLMNGIEKLATPEEIAKWNKEVLEPNHLHYSKSKRKIIDWFNQKDDVVVRSHNNKEWRLATFSHYSHINVNFKYCADSHFWEECLPYNKETAKLIGTTDDYKEDENND